MPKPIFLRKSKKKIINLLSAEFSNRVVEMKIFVITGDTQLRMWLTVVDCIPLVQAY